MAALRALFDSSALSAPISGSLFAAAANGAIVSAPDVRPFSAGWDPDKHPRGDAGRFGPNGGDAPDPDAPETKANLHNGRNAMWAAMSDQADQVAPLDRPGIGPTDVVWSRRGMGVKHILERRAGQDVQHPGRNKLSPEELCVKAVEAYSLGPITDSHGNRHVIRHEGITVLVAKAEVHTNAWIMNAYEDWPDSARDRRR